MRRIIRSSFRASVIPLSGLVASGLSSCGGDGSSSSGEQTLYSFANDANKDALGGSELLQAGDGNFYGTTALGGDSGDGTVFMITPTGAATVLHSFTGAPADGSGPTTSRLIQGADGNFYGTTGGGGANDFGAVYKLTPEGTVTILFSFAGGPADGKYTLAGLVQGTDGNFYGTTFDGGANNRGVVFRLTPTGVETVLYSFGAAGSGDAIGLATALIEGSDGNFYGTSLDGGASNQGTVFSITPAGVETVLHSFGKSGDGIQPLGRLTLGSDGALYGTTTDGGAHGHGMVFRLTPEGVETILYSFTGAPRDGSFPEAGLLQGQDGNFYGTTGFGGANNLGTVFKLTPGGVETVLHSFAGAPGDGSQPEGTLVEGSDGNLYGTTYQGGANNVGAFFRIRPN